MKPFSKKAVAELALRVANGEQEAFVELERVAQPLLRSLSSRFSSYHHRFEYDDFYMIGAIGLYLACLSYDPINPSFLDYAKVVMLREYWRELDYQNAAKRSVYANDLSYDQMLEDTGVEPIEDESDLFEIARINEVREHIESIVEQCFTQEKATIMKMFLFDEMRVIDIATELNLKYKNVHSTVKRGVEKIRKEYSTRFLDEKMVV